MVRPSLTRSMMTVPKIASRGVLKVSAARTARATSPSRAGSTALAANPRVR